MADATPKRTALGNPYLPDSACEKIALAFRRVLMEGLDDDEEPDTTE